MRVGYVRVSSLEQNTVRQLDGAEVERTFTDRASGKDTARPRLAEMLAFVREGDTVLVHSMDRLARDLEDLRGLVPTLTGKGVRVEFVKEGLVFTGEDSPMATLLLSVMGAFAEFERALILERQREGIAAARQRGAYTGRKPALTAGQASSCASAPPPASGSPRWPPSSASAAKPSTATCAPRPPRASPAEVADRGTAANLEVEPVVREGDLQDLYPVPETCSRRFVDVTDAQAAPERGR